MISLIMKSNFILMETEYIDEIGFVKISEQRQKIMKDLKDKLKIPTEIAKSTDMSVSRG